MERELKEYESELSARLRYGEGWREILVADDAQEYQELVSELVDLTVGTLGSIRTEGSPTFSEKQVLQGWLEVLERVADIAIDPDDELTEAERVETALITFRENVVGRSGPGWDELGLSFSVPNLFGIDEIDDLIDIREILDL